MYHFVITRSQVSIGTADARTVDVEFPGSDNSQHRGRSIPGSRGDRGPGQHVVPGAIVPTPTQTATRCNKHSTSASTTDWTCSRSGDDDPHYAGRAPKSTTSPDVRVLASVLTPACGTPHQRRRGRGDPPAWPTASRVQTSQGFVEARIAEGADYLKCSSKMATCWHLTAA